MSVGVGIVRGRKVHFAIFHKLEFRVHRTSREGTNSLVAAAEGLLTVSPSPFSAVMDS